MNVEYDYIREIFMREENRELWERFKAYYNRKRYFNYRATLRRISEEYKREYVDHISEEFKKSRDAGELDFSLFREEEQEKLKLLIENPEEYYRKYGMNEKDEDDFAFSASKAERRLKAVEESTTYKVGKIVMFLPITAKRLLKKGMKLLKK